MDVAPLKNSIRRQIIPPMLIIVVSLILDACRADLGKITTLETAQTNVPGTPLNHQLSYSPQKLPMRTATSTGQSGFDFSQPRLLQEINVEITPTNPPTIPTVSTGNLFPDSEIVYSPTAIDFDVNAYLEQTGGFLSSYRQYLMITGWTSASDIITRVAIENSINPRLLLVLLEYQSHCVLDKFRQSESWRLPSSCLGLQAQGPLRAVNLGSPGYITRLLWQAHRHTQEYLGARWNKHIAFS
jgi:hypothetical protein